MCDSRSRISRMSNEFFIMFIRTTFIKFHIKTQFPCLNFILQLENNLFCNLKLISFSRNLKLLVKENKNTIVMKFLYRC